VAETQVPRVILGRKVQQAPKALKASRVSRECKAPLVLKALKVHKAPQGKKATRERKARRRSLQSGQFKLTDQ
jgi:hypothetical protein